MKNPKAVILIFFLLLFGLVFQSTVFEFLKILGVRPDLVLLIIVFSAVRQGPLAGMIAGFTGGLMEGFFTPPYGFHALIKTVLGYVLGRFEGIVSLDPFFMRILFVAGATLLKGILSGFAHLVFGIAGPPFFTFGGMVILESLYNALLAPPVFFLLTGLKLFKTKGMETI